MENPDLPRSLHAEPRVDAGRTPGLTLRRPGKWATTCVPPGMPALDELVNVSHQTLVAPVEGMDETVMFAHHQGPPRPGVSVWRK